MTHWSFKTAPDDTGETYLSIQRLQTIIKNWEEYLEKKTNKID